ncbi:VAC17-like protein [Saccharomyces kudriavzevii IFO 1802]|uniref:VAC17-like protein n=1 Tax=Saccharomyces kudriavzevii (strain ATCC MYA-4449 / AS 2.2408 / CBS 8840 / NBRC 1802 / NCYC 2889) TaxID=226230 RepID=J6EI32_SACK1|nr:VAC17-like protein [Saccharomyces kudriavzevii IFO 1802]
MATQALEDITERLLIRSQEAILQLDLWIQRQQRSSVCQTSDQESLDKLSQQYNQYMSQLNSLYVRSESVRDKLSKEQQRRLITEDNEHQRIEDLVHEFQDITSRLNELATVPHGVSNDSPQSQSTRSSSGSFQPRPLKIIERQRVCMVTPSKPPKKSVGFNPINDVDCPSKTNSLPCSPKKPPAKNRTLRAAKSHDTGLNKSKKMSSTDAYESFFKNKQRLSLTFFDEMDDEDLDSDQDTIILPNISTPPHMNVTAKGAEFEPLRRYNSHESILSNKPAPIMSLSLGGFPGSFYKPSHPTFGTSTSNVQVDCHPTITVSMASRRNGCYAPSSKALLSSFIARPDRIAAKQDPTNLKHTSFLDKFNSSLSTISESFQNKKGKKNKDVNDGRISYLNHIATQEQKKNIMDMSVSIEELQDALNTELLF